MNNNLPTTPGHYWWREEKGDEWVIIQVDLAMLNDEPEVNGTCCESPLSGEYVHVSELGGQWAKAHRPDEGIEAWAVFGSSGKPQAIDRDPDMCRSKVCHWDQESWNILMKHGYTCEPVTIFRKDKE